MPRGYFSTIKIYRDAQGTFSWMLVGANGFEICESSSIYPSRRKCEEAVQRFRVMVVNARIVESAELL